MTPPRLLVVQHEPTCPPALLAASAAAGGVVLDVVRVHEDEAVPRRVAGSDALAVLGGVMGVHEAPAYPHLHDVMALIRDAAARSVPVLGICLGAQLAAHALGGRAYPGAAGLEAGWVRLELTDQGRGDPVVGALAAPAGARAEPAGPLAAPVEVFEWHTDTFDLPPGARLLARGDRYAAQAFRLGSVVAVQFHPEVDAPLISAWYRADREAIGTAGRETTVDGEAVLLAGVAERTARQARLLDAFCQMVAAGAGRA